MPTHEPELVGTTVIEQAWQGEAAARGSLWSTTVVTLTSAARLTRTRADGHVGPDDFADFLASALAAVAGNLGNVDLVTAGRPGSWEAALVTDLVRCTVGWDPDELVSFRTEPVVVPLNVAQLVEDTGCLTSFLEAEEGLPFTLDEGQQSAWDRMHTRYQQLFERYARAFTAVVQAHALTIPGLVVPGEDGAPTLRVPVIVQAETDPALAYSGVQNPSEWDADPLPWRLWEHAVDTIGLPSFDDAEPTGE